MSTASNRSMPGAIWSRGRVANAINLGIFLLAAATLGIVANFFAQQPSFRAQIDATKTRAYSLSEQTLKLLAHLDGPWTIAMVSVRQLSDPAEQRQVDEVLERYVEASPNISVIKVDPADPRTISKYESLLSRLRGIYQVTISQYDEALDAGTAAFEQVRLFTQQQAAPLRAILAKLGEGDQGPQGVRARFEMLALVADEGGKIVKQVEDARRVNDEQPIPDYEAARSILAQTLSDVALQCSELSRLLDGWVNQSAIDPAMRQFAAQGRREYSDMARTLAAAADPLKRLAPLEISSIGRQLQEGEVAVIIGPARAAVIPSTQLFPKTNLRGTTEGTIRFDQRFRGEQLFSAAIRSLLVDRMPMVVFVHAEEESMLKRRDRQNDLLGVATMLNTARYVIREWQMGQGDRPTPATGQKAVWIVVPPGQRSQLEPTEREKQLVEATRRLIADGESVLLSVYPSMLPKYKHPDPWQSIAEPMGLSVDTGRVIFESVRVSEDQVANERGAAIQTFNSNHPIARAIDGQQAYFGLPVPISLSPQGSSQEQMAHVESIAEIGPSPNRWAEADWSADPRAIGKPARDELLTGPAVIVAAAERDRPADRGRQRMIVVGSGGWLLSFVSDVVVSLGGDRVALANPGNHELALASVAWLAGMDDLIAPGASTHQVARLSGLTTGVRTTWIGITVLTMPLACLFLGVAVWTARRR